MNKILNLVFIALSILGCQSAQQSSYQNDLPKQTQVAILLPISGADQVMGKKLNELINLGLRDGAARNLSINTYDIGGSKGVEAAMEKVLLAKPDLIIGPISSADTKQVAELARPQNIVTITLSNDPSVAGPDVYVFGHAPLQQTKRLMNYLALINVNHMILLLPEGPASENLAKVVTEIARKKAINVVQVFKYSALEASIEKNVQSVSSLVDSLNEDPDNTTKAAVYISGQGQDLRTLFDTLRQYEVDQKAIVCGENKIDIDYEKPIDIIFPSSLNFTNSNLSQQILQNNFGTTYLSFWDKMAYDAGLVASYSIGTEDFTRERFLSRLSNPGGYVGVSGSLRFYDYVTERKYDIIKRSNYLYEVLDKDKSKSKF